MNVNLMNPFLRAAKEVLEQETGLQVSRGDLSLQRSCYTGTDITTLLSVMGDVRGVVLYGIDEPMALQLVSTMLGQPQELFDELAQSGIAELGNVITGLATTGLGEAGYRCNISVPTLIIGRGTMISTLDFQRLTVPLHTEIGSMTIHLALREDPGHTATRQPKDTGNFVAQPPAPTLNNVGQIIQEFQVDGRAGTQIPGR